MEERNENYDYYDYKYHHCISATHFKKFHSHNSNTELLMSEWAEANFGWVSYLVNNQTVIL